MTIKRLAGNRIQGIRAERFSSLKSTGISLTGCQAYYTFNNGCNNHATTENGFPDGLGSTLNGTSVIGVGGITPIDGVSGNGAVHYEHAVHDLGDDIVSGTQDFSISCWIKPTGNFTSYRSIISNYETDGSHPNGFEFLLTNNSTNTARFYLQGGTPDGSVNLPSYEWSHVALTRSSGTVTIYTNGTSDAYATHNESIDGGPMRIGGITPTSEFFQGGFAEVSIWSRALTAAEIYKLAAVPQDNGIVFEETDTSKSYIWNSSTSEWTQVG